MQPKVGEIWVGQSTGLPIQVDRIEERCIYYKYIGTTVYSGQERILENNTPDSTDVLDGLYIVNTYERRPYEEVSPIRRYWHFLLPRGLGSS